MSGLAWETAHLCAWDTGLTADSVEAVPSALGFRGFACSTYQLDPATGQRHGSVTLLRVADDASMLAPQCTLSCAGVLDAKWGTRHPVLAAACADATLRIVATNEDGTELRVLAEHDWQDASLCLSVDWDDRAALGASPARVAVSHSNGRVSVCGLEPSGLVELDSWQAHDLMGCATEVWITAFDCWRPHCLLTGADDCKLKGWDLRLPGSATFCVGSKEHEGGVCSAQFHAKEEHVLATGSYDQRVRLWDMRRMAAPLWHGECGGGVWRLKFHPLPEHKHLLLAACMRGGVHVWRCGPAWNEAERIAWYGGHEAEQLAYGADWAWWAEGRAGQHLVCTCSFYDHSCHVWRMATR